MVEDILVKSAAFVYVMAPVLSLVINILIQVLSFRTLTRISLLKSVYLGFIAGLFSVIIIDILYSGYSTFPLRKLLYPGIINMITYAALGYCYFNFVVLSETARRIRMLIEIYDSGKEGLSIEEMLHRYNAGEIAKKRIGRLLGNGQLRCEGGKYFIGKPMVLLLANWIMLFKIVLLGKRSEFD